MSSERTQLLTVGHGTRPLDELVALLVDAGVDVLDDVRRYPGSRRNPQYGRDAVASGLADGGVGYEWWGEHLGGRRAGVEPSRHPAWRNAAFRAYADHMDTPAFRDAFAALVDQARRRRVAVMCSETLWWHCHRRLIADAATACGLEVVHIGAGRPQVHRLDPSARVDADGRVVYDVGTPRPLGADDRS